MFQSKYVVPLIDPTFAARRQLIRQGEIRDLGVGTMRPALHLSCQEHDLLELANPETLGRNDDERLKSQYWRDFINSPYSEPFRLGNKV
jgi:hypothetical protein